MVIWGWIRRPILLGVKGDLCPTCDAVTPHAIYRVTTWGHVFWVPFLLLWIRHGLYCTACGREQKLGWRQTRRALRAGSLPLGPRPHFRDWAMRAFDETGRMPQEADLDAVEVNRKRGPWNLWLAAWPLLVIALVSYVVLDSAIRPPAQAPAPVAVPTAHQCWEDRSKELVGCRMDDGNMVGTTEGDPITCYFIEPLPSAETRIYCD